MAVREDATGNKYNMLIAVSYSHTRKRKVYWLFKCECGGSKIASICKVKNNRTKSCGCLLTKHRERGNEVVDFDFGISGIYAITNIINKKVYYGSSKCIRHRIFQHISLLNKNIHYNKVLQEDWSKFGKDAFKFELIEVCQEDNLLKAEIHHIRNNENIYNIMRYAINHQPKKPNKRPCINVDTGEIFESIAQASKEVGIKPGLICDTCAGRQKTAGGYKWEYYSK